MVERRRKREEALQALDRRFDPAVDKAEWLLFLSGYLKQPSSERVAAFDAALGLTKTSTSEDLPALLERSYADTKLGDAQTRLALMDASSQEFGESEYPFIKLAGAMYDYGFELETASKTRAGRSLALRPAYMEAITEWQRAKGQLTDLDPTGGNSGSATLNARAELVGLLFDGTFESVNLDWNFDPRTTRTIHVDTRYMSWVMEKVDGAGALNEEMDEVE